MPNIKPQLWKAVLPISIVLGFLWWAAPPIQAQTERLDWQPQRTWVFVVGVLEWKDSQTFGSFPKEKRRDADLVDFFRTKGVPKDHILYLQDQAATTRHIGEALQQHLAKAGPDDLLFLYYCGHGYEEGSTVCFASYNVGGKVTGWEVPSIIDAIESSFNGSRAFLAADCCQSGALIREINKRKLRVSYAGVTSTTSNTTSTERWTFTEALLDGLRGEAWVDLNDDGQITLQELFRNVEEDMGYAEGQKASFASHGKFSSDTRLANASRKANPRIGERVAVTSDEGTYAARIVEVKGEKYRAHYIGYDESTDVWVPANRLKPIQPTRYATGQQVEVEWKGKWYPAKILKIELNVHLIHYDDYDQSWDEWVAADRIRLTGNHRVTRKGNS